jgi:hypothetical protein
MEEEDAFAALDDLQRCDGFSPCGECDRCTEGGRPWKECAAEFLKILRGEVEQTPSGPAGSPGTVGWMGGEFDR